MPRSALNRLTELHRCGGLLSRLAYDRARNSGLDVASLLHEAGLTPHQIKNKDARVDVENQIKFVNLVARARKDVLLGLHLAHAYDLREIGLLYYVIASADTLFSSLIRAARYSVLANDGITLNVRRDGHIRVGLKYTGIARHSDVHQIEFWIASVIRIVRHLAGRKLEPIRVRIMHERRKELVQIEKLIGGRVETGAPVDEVILPEASGDCHNVKADPYLSQLCVGFCEESLTRMKAKSSPLKVQVENTIASLLPYRQMHISETAARLGMSSRTLSRKLASDGHGYSEILDGLRAALAERYLTETELPVSQIAWLLGYSEIGAFTHAFRRWTGTNPRTARMKAWRSDHAPLKKSGAGLRSTSKPPGKRRISVNRKRGPDAIRRAVARP